MVVSGIERPMRTTDQILAFRHLEHNRILQSFVSPDVGIASDSVDVT